MNYVLKSCINSHLLEGWLMEVGGERLRPSWEEVGRSSPSRQQSSARVAQPEARIHTLLWNLGNQQMPTITLLHQTFLRKSVIFFLKIYLFMIDTDRERLAETQAEGEAGSIPGAWCGTQPPGAPGSRPGPKAGAKPLSHPGIPKSVIFRYR